MKFVLKMATMGSELCGLEGVFKAVVGKGFGGLRAVQVETWK